MAARVTIERILRDADDVSGQSVRDWTIQAEPGHLTIRLKHGDGFIMLNPDDVKQFVHDLYRAEEQARTLT